MAEQNELDANKTHWTPLKLKSILEIVWTIILISVFVFLVSKKNSEKNSSIVVPMKNVAKCVDTIWML